MPNGFSALGIREDLVEQMKATGVVEPTLIQQQAIPVLMTGKDMIGQAQTGTGKTFAFLLPILERIDTNSSAVQALIITPTRELALQISAEAKKLASIVGAHVLAAYGGQDVEQQIRKLKGSIHLVIGTPGRLLDHLRRGTLNFRNLTMLVLDEADQMLQMGFLNEVREILEQTPSDRQTMLFSATMPKEIRTLAKRYLQAPTEVKVQSQRVTLDTIQQIVIETTDRLKQTALLQTLESYNPFLAIIFCRTKRRASALNAALQGMGYNSDELHGDLTQAKREKVMNRFREAKIQYLVATDVAARGLDVEGVTHVFNYDIPHDVESYIHRIGRTGRAGETGVSVTFVAPKDRDFLRLIEQGIHRRIERRTVNGAQPSARPPRSGGSRGQGAAREQGVPRAQQGHSEGQLESRRGRAGVNKSSGRRSGTRSKPVANSRGRRGRAR